jgi:hypothetical protein
VVSPKDAERKTGAYWGYQADAVTAFSDVFRNLSPNTYKILIDPDSPTLYSADVRTKVRTDLVASPTVQEVLVFFAGKGLKHLHGHDEQTKITFQSLKDRFDAEFAPDTGVLGLNGLHLDEQISFFLHDLFAVIPLGGQ